MSPLINIHLIMKTTTGYSGCYCRDFDAGVSTEPAEKRLRKQRLDK